MLFCVLCSVGHFLDCNNVRLSQGHVLDALGVTDDWYREYNETLSLVIAYGERGEEWDSPRIAQIPSSEPRYGNFRRAH
jgi:hypothetical protein